MLLGATLTERYVLEQLLGEGGMGSVYRARDLATGGHVAIKVLKQTDDGAKRRLLREARAASSVRHRAVVRVLDVLDLDEGPALVLELLEGESLGERLGRERVLPLAFVARVLVDVCDALLAAHALGIVHRDLKPDNIFLTPDAEHPVKVLDFGIAKLTALDGEAQATAGLMTTTGTLMGTPVYMAPEQVYGEKDPDARIDVWAMGLIVYQCLTGILPTQADNVGQVLRRILSDAIRPLREVAPALPGDLCGAVDRMLARRREERASDVDELRDVLARHAGSALPTVTRPSVDPLAATAVSRSDEIATGPTLLAGTDPPRVARPAAAITRAKPRWRGRAVALVAAIALLAGTGAIAAKRFRKSAAAPAPSTVAVATSPLDAPDSVLACPILEAGGVHAPSGWLGAAAAQRVCLRATWLLGGRYERTRIPAELLDLVPTPSDDAPLDPFGAAEARARTLEAAKKRSSAYVDGRVDKTPAGFEVKLRVVDVTRATESATVSGSGEKLGLAVNAAVDALVAAHALPAVTTLDPEIVRIYDVRTPRAGVLLEDLADRPATDLCAEAAAAYDELGAYRKLFSSLCRDTKGIPKETFSLDDRSVGTLSMSAFTAAYAQDKQLLGLVRPMLERRLAAERAPRARSQLIQSLTVVGISLGEPTEQLGELLLEAVRLCPRDVYAWSMSFGCAQPGGHRALARAAHAWNAAVPVPPWLASSMSYEAALPFFRRSWELDGFASESLETYAIAAIQTGHREEASALAGACRSGPAGVRPTGEAIAARLEIDQGGFASGQRRLLAAVLGVERYGPKDLRAYAPLQSLLLIARVLRNEPTIADPVVEAFVLSDPPRVELSLEQEPHQAIPWVAFCMSASRPVAERCFARFEAWKGAGKFPTSAQLDAYLVGAVAFARGDVAVATRAWGPVFRSRATTELLPWDALERFDPEAGVLAVPIVDEQVPMLAGVPITAPREARRAARKGDPKRARELAEKVIAGWRTADVTVPAVAEMRQLLATLK